MTLPWIITLVIYVIVCLCDFVIYVHKERKEYDVYLFDIVKFLYISIWWPLKTIQIIFNFIDRLPDFIILKKYPEKKTKTV